MTFDTAAQRDYLRNVSLDSLAAPMGATALPDVVFDNARKQAVVAGSEVVSFTDEVEKEFREAISDSALVAQLGANARFDAKEDPIAWFDHYFSILGGLGWTTQVRDTAKYSFTRTGMEVHEAVLDVIKVFLGPIPGALALAELALTSLKKMDENSPMITLFNRESERASVGRFQFTVIRRDGEGLLADAMCFGLKAENKLTQLLFFKVHKAKTRLRRSLATLSIGADALEDLRPRLKAKVQEFRPKFLAELPLAT